VLGFPHTQKDRLQFDSKGVPDLHGNLKDLEELVLKWDTKTMVAYTYDVRFTVREHSLHTRSRADSNWGGKKQKKIGL